jgi:hypothetical protein
MEQLVRILPTIEATSVLNVVAGDIDKIRGIDRVEGAALQGMRKLLDELDKSQHWGGLKKVMTPEGHFLWLCEHHTKEYIG